MRILLIIPVLSLTAFFSPAKITTPIANPLNGTWVPVKQELGGKEFPSAVYASQKMILEDTLYTVIAESADKGVARYDGNKIDIYGKEGPNAGKHFTAIYKLENEQLTICYNLAGDTYPEDFSTAGKPLFFLSVFKREPVQ